MRKSKFLIVLKVLFLLIIGCTASKINKDIAIPVKIVKTVIVKPPSLVSLIYGFDHADHLTQNRLDVFFFPCDENGNDIENPDLAYIWDFNTTGVLGGPKDLVYMTHVGFILHKFEKPGDYKVMLIVKDMKTGKVERYVKTVTVRKEHYKLV